MAIYLIDYENVYIDGLQGLEFLTNRDKVVIFYTQNRCGLTFEMHRKLNSCRAVLELMEVTAISTQKNTVKNALDLQLSMYIGYLVGSNPNVPIYIVSNDMDFDLDLTFFSQYLDKSRKNVTLSLCSSIQDGIDGIMRPNASQILLTVEEDEVPLQQTKKSNSEITKQSAKRKGGIVVSFPDALQDAVRDVMKTNDPKTIHRICAIVTAAEDLLSLNNLLLRYYHDSQQVKDVYQTLKPSFPMLRALAHAEPESFS